MSNHACNCPGAALRTIEKKETLEAAPAGRQPSELRQWPTQLHLVPPHAPWLQNADLLIAADCTPFAYPNFHQDFIKGRVLVNACPKLDDTSPYLEKLTAILKQNEVRSVTVTIMEVPCCRGLAILAQQAVAASGKNIPLEIAVLGIDGERRS